MLKGDSMAIKKSMLRGGIAVSSSLFAALLAAMPVANAWRGQIDSALKTSSYKTTDGTRYSSIYSTTDELVAEHKRLGEQAGEESVVLLKNKDNVLPLAKASADQPKITLFGMGSEYTKFGGNMGSSSSGVTSLYDGLTARGFQINPTLRSVYQTLGSVVTGRTEPVNFWEQPQDIYGHRPGDFAGALNPYTVTEPNPELYYQPKTEDINCGGGATESGLHDSFEEYNAAALVVFTRPGSEGSDYYEGAAGNTDTTRDVLELSENEEAVLQLAKDNFENVIVLINSCNPLEIDELKKDDKIKGIVWIGFPGDYGTFGIASVLKGFNGKGEQVSPSGGLVDVYAVDNSNNPAVKNLVGYSSLNAEDVKWENSIMKDPNTGEPLSAVTPSSTFSWTPSLASEKYIIEAEGIYSGYKYYESRYYDSIVNPGSNATSSTGASNGALSWAYENEVSYTFGEGYSYTTFSKELASIRQDGKKLIATVNVKNTGNYAGKTPVQIYAQTPYTNYDKTHGVEKSAIQLVNFEKTDTIAPGASVSVEVELPFKHFASWDSTLRDGNGGYILDGGDYYFAVGNGAHDAVNAVLAAQGHSVPNSFSTQAKVWNYQVSGEVDGDTLRYSDTDVEVKNELSDMDWNHFKKDTVTYLSRQDYDATFPKTYSGLSYVADNETLMNEWKQKLTNEVYQIKTTDTVEIEKAESKTTYTIADMAAVEDINDSRWDDLVKQIPAKLLYTRLLRGGSASDVIEEVKSPMGYQNDGPNGFQSTLGSRGETGHVAADDKNASFAMNSMVGMNNLGATFSKEIALAFGEQVGNDGLWSGNWSIWGVGSNIHRSPYNGRNFEYYSEDGILNGYIGKGVVQGALKYGVINAPKHFAFNDQETYRGGIAPYMTEQKAREGDLRAFQIPVEDGHALGLMTSFNRAGATQVNGHDGLMNGILRKEWGFKGLISTDMASNKGLYRAELCILGGASMVADFETGETFEKVTADWAYMTEDLIKHDATLLSMARRNMKYQFYAFANSAASNVKTERVIPAWEGVLIGGSIATGIIAVGLVILMVMLKMKAFKQN